MLAQPTTRLTAYLTPSQATVLRYDGTLPQATLDSLCERLRGELVGLQSLLPSPLLYDPLGLEVGSGTFWDGTLLCADLSGFTALTGMLAAGGRQGVEEVCALINQIFAALLEEIDTYGGSVLKFGGDALTAFFDAAHLGEEHALAACAAALALQERMRAFERLATSCGPRTLRLRVAVHSGRVFVATIGDESRRELLVTGRAINLVALAQERAAPGEVLVSPVTLALVGEAATEPRRGGLLALGTLAAQPAPRKLLPPPPLPAGNDLATLDLLAARLDMLRPYVPSALPQRFLLEDTPDSGEFRPVSAVFVNFFSFSGLLSLLEGEEQVAVAGLDAYFRGVHQLVQTYGGSINKLDISGFGDKLLLLFGAPHAHEDDPQRAVATALELERVLAQANGVLREAIEQSIAERRRAAPPPWRAISPALRQRVGVATGTVFAGMVGSAVRREYTVIGQTVNLAARLMAAAEPQAVLLEPTTARLVAGKIALAQLSPVQLKGVGRSLVPSQALRSAAATAPPPVPAPIAPLVGRSSELGMLRTLAHEALAGSGAVVTLRGEAGIGKSRLAAELLNELSGSEMGCIALSCHSAAQTPLPLWRELLCAILCLPSGCDRALLRGPLAELVADYAPAYLRMLPLLDEVLGGVATALPLAATERQRRLLDLVVGVVGGLVARQPLALLIDDLHAADESSLALVRRLADLAQTKPLLLLLAYRLRPGRPEPWHDRDTLCLDLQSLDRESSTALLVHLLGDEVPAALAPLLDRAQGVPLFVEAYVRHLVDSGILVRGDAGWQFTRPLSEVSIPMRVERVLAAQLDQFDEAIREVIQAAAVIGTEVPYPLLAGVYSQARRLAYHVTYLVGVGVFVLDESDPDAPLRFRQTLLRDVVYNSILYARRRELHRRVAERLGQLYGAALDEHADELAFHYLLAEEWSPALAWSLVAAQQAVARYDVAAARSACQRAVALAEAAASNLDEADQRALDRLRRLGEAL